jgi:hypothetical protein
MTLVAPAAELPWVVLETRNETRDEEMQAWDDADSQALVKLMNQDERLRDSQFAWRKTPLESLLDAGTPFAMLNLDPVRPMELTAREKEVLLEWIERGGFLLVMEDAYPYEQEEFRKHPTLPVYEFLMKELPRGNPLFGTGDARTEHAVYNLVYPTEMSPWIRVELEENPHYRGRTFLEYKGRMVAFFMGRYSVMREGRWVPMRRPFPPRVSRDARGYYLILNLYAYATMH